MRSKHTHTHTLFPLRHSQCTLQRVCTVTPWLSTAVSPCDQTSRPIESPLPQRPSLSLPAALCFCELDSSLRARSDWGLPFGVAPVAQRGAPSSSRRSRCLGRWVYSAIRQPTFLTCFPLSERSGCFCLSALHGCGVQTLQRLFPVLLSKHPGVGCWKVC